MTVPVFTYILHKDGAIDDTAAELAVAAKALIPDANPTAIVFGSGDGMDSVCGEAAALFKEVWKIDDASFGYPNAEVIREVLCKLLPDNAFILIPHEHFGMDLSPGLSIKLDASYLSDVVELSGIESNLVKAVRQEYNGQASTRVTCDATDGTVITVRPGSFQAEETGSVEGGVVDKTTEAKDAIPLESARRFMEVVEAEAGDVDITKSDILVSVGRGLEDEDNLDMIHDLAAAVGGEVSCSRPIVDANWLEKARQVGSSGQTVKPKVYMALGISGSFQHLAGLKGNPFVLAVNKNIRAPIFQVADVGVLADILELVPALTGKIKKM